MDRPAYDPNAQRLERQDQEHEIKIIEKRELKMIRNTAKRLRKKKLNPNPIEPYQNFSAWLYRTRFFEF